MDGMTGLNSYEAKKNIKDFCDKAFALRLDILVFFESFFDNLSALWASENAVKFFKEKVPLADELLLRFDEEINENSISLCEAYNVVAGANGAELIPVQGYSQILSGEVPSSSVEAHLEINGVTGMNIRMVRDILLPSYETRLNQLIAGFDNLPAVIALYDDENGQQTAFSTSVRHLKTKFINLSEEIFNDIDANITSEVDTVRLAKEKSTSTLSGTA